MPYWNFVMAAKVNDPCDRITSHPRLVDMKSSRRQRLDQMRPALVDPFDALFGNDTNAVIDHPRQRARSPRKDMAGSGPLLQVGHPRIPGRHVAFGEKAFGLVVGHATIETIVRKKRKQPALKAADVWGG